MIYSISMFVWVFKVRFFIKSSRIHPKLSYRILWWFYEFLFCPRDPWANRKRISLAEKLHRVFFFNACQSLTFNNLINYFLSANCLFFGTRPSTATRPPRQEKWSITPLSFFKSVSLVSNRMSKEENIYSDKFNGVWVIFKLLQVNTQKYCFWLWLCSANRCDDRHCRASFACWHYSSINVL